MTTEIERMESMDSQRFDISKRPSTRATLSIQTGLSDSDDEAESSLFFRSSRPPSPTGSWDSAFARDVSPERSDSAEGSTPPLSESSSITLEDAANPRAIHQTDVFNKGDYSTTRTIIRPIARSPLLGCFSRPSSPVTSRPSSPLGFARATSPLNFGTLNCCSTDAFKEQADHTQVQRARELDGRAQVQVHVEQVVHSKREDSFIVATVLNESEVRGEGLRRRAMEPRGIISSP